MGASCGFGVVWVQVVGLVQYGCKLWFWCSMGASCGFGIVWVHCRFGVIWVQVVVLV